MHIDQTAELSKGGSCYSQEFNARDGATVSKIVRSYRVRSWLMCDDIRIENNGKYLLIGVYSGTVRLRRPLPVTLSTLSFWIQLDLKKLDYGDYELRLLDPRRQEAAHLRGPARFTRVDEPGVVICLTGPLTLSSYGTYSVEFGFGRPLRLLGSFAVHSPEEATPFKAAQATYPALAGLSRQH